MKDSFWNQDLLPSLAIFYKNISAFLNELGISEPIKRFKADYVGLQYKENAQVEKVKKELLQISKNKKPLSEAIVNGRKIYIFELENPVLFGNWEIPCIELPYPKANHIYTDGWEHIEFVIPSSATSLDELRDAVVKQFPSISIKKLQEKGWYSESMPTADVKQLPNPAIIFRKEHNLAIKFHPRTIKEIILSEKEFRIVH